jgi:hypothetical protein
MNITFPKRIKDSISTARRLPRLGKIRLGIKKVSQKSGKEYPTETNHFVVPAEVAAVYGHAPRELDVMFPVNDEETVFPQQLEFYGSGKGLKCVGNKETAMERTEKGGWQERTCPCERLEKGECSERGHLLVMLPKVSVGGLYQIDTGSYHSIVDVNSGIDYVRALVGRIAMVPLKLRRVARETHAEGTRQVHYTLQLTLDANVEGINKLREDTTRVIQYAHYQIEGPVMENPASDPPDVVVEQEPEEVEAEVVQGEGLNGSSGDHPASQPATQDVPAPKPAEPKEPANEHRMVIEGTMGTWQPRKGKPPGRFVLHTEAGDYDIKFWDEKLAAGRGEGRGIARCTIELVQSGRFKDYFLVAPIEWPEWDGRAA